MARGSIQDLIALIGFATVAIIFFAAYYSVHVGYIAPAFNNFFGNQTDLDLTAPTTIINQTTAAEEVIGHSISIIILLMGVSALVLAFMIPSHPIYLPFSIILGALYIYLASVSGNLIYTVLGQDIFNNAVEVFPEFPAIADNLPLIIAVFWFLLVIINYSNPAAGSSLRKSA